ncbi:MAG: S1 RNA-binding domain-containing protein [Myxococcota bacterium]|nr:S1 RNA-binding domain-containing protein [Myxococcota bacterium]
MDFVDFVRTLYRDQHDAIPRSALQRFGRTMDRTGALGPLLEANDATIEPFSADTLAVLADIYREYLEWKEAAKSFRRHVSQNGLALPDGSRNIAHTPHELSALERTATLCQRSGHPDHGSWAEAVAAHVALWRAAVDLSLAHGSAIIRMEQPEHPDASEFEGHVTARVILSEIRGYNWLAIRRGERAGILSVILELPWHEILRQTDARLPQLGLIAMKRKAEAVMADLIERELDQTIRDLLDSKAKKEAVTSVRTAYMSLLGTPPLQADRVLAAYVGRPDAPLGLAIVDKRGDVVKPTQIPPGMDIAAPITQMIEAQSPAAAVLPLSSEDKNRLREVETAIGSLPVQRIHDAAISEARKNLPFEPAASSAVVLGRRALKPGREWGRVDPLLLHLGEYPRELNLDHLRTILTEAKLISSWERRKKTSTKKPGIAGRSASTLPSGKRLNSFVKTIRDLRPEMVVDGIITNITRFGAFVNIGLATEGMIHVSQLSTEFVEDPSQVVRVGQQIKARILEVIPEKDRIALSLKPQEDRSPRETGPLPQVQSGQKREAPKTRSAALADLDALFKK